MHAPKAAGAARGEWHLRRVHRSYLLALVASASLVQVACDTSATSVDAGLVFDAAPRDATIDAPALDAGCTLTPGELLGERSVESGQLPALAFTTSDATLELASFHTPCAAPGEVLVVRELAAWSAPALWHAAHTASVTALEGATVVDLWVADEDALPLEIGEGVNDLERVLGAYDVVPEHVAVDPEETLAPLAIGGIQLPIVVIVDRRTLDVERTLFAPHEGDVERAVRSVRARLRGEPAPSEEPPPLVDERFTADEWELIQAMAQPIAAPPSPTNAVADDPRAAMLGGLLFEETRFSPEGVSCGTCHASTLAFQDGLPRGVGLVEVGRNTPTVLGALGSRWQFLDGRADTLWGQAVGPIENAREMGGSRLRVVHRVAASYRAPYEALFGPLPDVDALPAEGMPGDAAYDALDAITRQAVTRVLVNVGKSIEAYERLVTPPSTRFDAYAHGELDALTSEERDGLRVFFLAGCVQCHAGPRFANDAFHAIGMPGSGTGDALDLGRFAALASLASSPFRAQGAFSDDPSVEDPAARWVARGAFPESTRGAFRTPTLRAIASTAPYGHAGTFETLEDVTLHYARIAAPHDPDPRVAGVVDPHVSGFDAELVPALVAFLRTL